MVAWLPLAMVGPLFYAIEGNYRGPLGHGGDGPGAGDVRRLGRGRGDLRAAAGAGIGPVDRPDAAFGRAEGALVLSSVVHALMYAGYVWLAARAGAVFASQIAYVVTGAGVVLGHAASGRAVSPLVWAALAVMLAG